MDGSISASPLEVYADKYAQPGIDLQQPIQQQQRRPVLKTRRSSSEDWGSTGLSDLRLDINVRAPRHSIAYIPTPRASRGFHEHDGRKAFDENFLEFLRQKRLHSEHPRKLSLSSLSGGLYHRRESYRRASTPAAPARYSFSRSMKQLRRRLEWRFSRIFRPILPDSTLNHSRELVLFGILTFQLFYIPFHPVYLTGVNKFPQCQKALRTITVMAELALLADMLLNFNTAFYDKQRSALIIDRREIARHYLAGNFIPDFLGLLPMKIITWASALSEEAGTNNRTAYIISILLRFLWLRHLPGLSKAGWLRVTRQLMSTVSQKLCIKCHSTLSVIGEIIVLSIIVVHYCTCVLRSILDSYQDPESKSLQKDEPSLSSIAAQYTRDILQVTSSLLGNSWETNEPVIDAYSIFLMLTGLLASAYITSKVALEILMIEMHADKSPRSCEQETARQYVCPKPRCSTDQFLPVNAPQHGQVPKKPRILSRSLTQPNVFSPRYTSYNESAAPTAISSRAERTKWSEAPLEVLTPCSSTNSDIPVTTSEQLNLNENNTSPDPAPTDMLQLLASLTKTVHRVEAKLDALYFDINTANRSKIVVRLPRSKSDQGERKRDSSKKIFLHSRSLRSLLQHDRGNYLHAQLNTSRSEAAHKSPST
ncbi:unnamed protein product [Phytophthora lilii]|uniref:Unnamed protein product n=1 Tax=Phytophthora lilii TaxID=2077276 RepID=A0A9W6WQG6_9STRA|nr:unnamed protein product [Phytophthora lilii]